MATGTLHIIYYLSREGQLEEPHLLEVPVSASNSKGLHLTEVKKWLMLARGKSMPASFSWSYKRNYKAGCIWQDVSADEDLVLPISEGEYILKGSKFVVASKELCPEPALAKLDQNTHNDYDCTVRVKEDIMRGGTKGLPAGNEQKANVGEDSCQLTFASNVTKSNIMCGQHSLLVDASSPCVMVNNRPLVNSDSSILELAQTLEHACQTGREGEETESHRDSANTTVASLHGSSPTALTLEVIQAKSVTTDSSKMDKQIVDLNVADNARLLKTINHRLKYQSTGTQAWDTDISYMNVAENTTLLQTVDNHMKHHTGGGDDSDKQTDLNVVQSATDSVDVAFASKNFKRTPNKAINLKTNGYLTPSSTRAVTSRLDHKPTKHTKPKSILKCASCKVMNANVTGCEDKQIKHASKMVVMQRRIRTKGGGCRYTPVWLTHVKSNNVGDLQLPSSIVTAEGVRQDIGGGSITWREKKSSNERESYSHELGVQLPATMVIKDVAVVNKPLCPFHQRVVSKQAPFSSFLTPVYDHKKATCQYLPKKSSLPVFGSEERQQQLLEELNLCHIQSGVSDINRTRNSNHSQLLCMQQASKPSWHDENSRSKNSVGQCQNVSRMGTKLLWKELLQTTQDALKNHQETI